MKTTAEAIVEVLIENGVDTVFGIPGAHMYDFNDALGRRADKINFVTTRHEQGAAYMAYGYAKSTGKIGVYTVVPGPGFLNSSAAICTAYGANVPVFCITGNIMSHLIGKGRGQLHELPDQLSILRGLCKWADRINHPSEVNDKVSEAFRQLRSGRPRPVAIEVPWDVFGQKGLVEAPNDPVPIKNPIPLPSDITHAAELIKKSKNPLIMVGGGALEAGEQVLALAKLIQAPVTAHRSGKGIVSEELPYGMSFPAAFEYWKSCDLLIGIGSRLELQHFRWRWFPEGLKTIRIDIDPTEMVRLKSDVGIVADANEGLKKLIERVRELGIDRGNRETEFRLIKETVQKDIDRIEPQMSYLKAIRNALPNDGFFVEEISQVGFTSRFGFPSYKPRRFVTGGYQDNLGFGFNTGIGVKIAHPQIPVVCVCGDGGFMFGVQELATAVQNRIGIVVVVFNNSSYGNVRRDQLNNYDGRLLGADLVNPDFVALARSFGAIGQLAENPDELQEILLSSFHKDLPTVIEIKIDKGSEESPWPFIHPSITELD